mgnify:CR=1 FL=1
MMNKEELTKEAKEVLTSRGINEQVYARFHILLLSELNNKSHEVHVKIDKLINFMRLESITEDAFYDMMLLSSFILISNTLDSFYVDILNYFNCICGQEAFIKALAGLMWSNKFEPLECTIDTNCVSKIEETQCSEEQQRVCKAKRELSALYISFFFTIRAVNIPLIVAYDLYKKPAKNITSEWIGLFATYIESVLEFLAIKDSIKSSDIHEWHLQEMEEEALMKEEQEANSGGAEIIPFPNKKDTLH